VDHELNFYDSINGQQAAYDDNGHGTHTMGTMVGSDGENKIGVAPGAQWIAAKILDAGGSGNDSDIMYAGQWFLAPVDYEGNLHPEAAPDVVNNSWGSTPGDTFYDGIMNAWRAAGIFPAFSNGNSGPGAGTSGSPGGSPMAFSAGAVDSAGKLASFSSRGPSRFDEIKPDITAPGVSIRSSMPGGGYSSMNGTSMASPHVAGTVALIQAANASLSVDEIENLLYETATPTTDATYGESPNNGYGYGIINAELAVATIIDGVGQVSGIVQGAGDDVTPPGFHHEEPAATVYEGLDFDVPVAVITDNVSVDTVEFAYTNAAGEQSPLGVARIGGDVKNGTYDVGNIPAADVLAPNISYTWTVTDYGGNTERYAFTVPVAVDEVPPTFVHVAPLSAYEGFTIPLTVEATDNVSISSVTFTYDGGSVAGTRIEGTSMAGTYTALIPATAVGAAGTTFAYTVDVRDTQSLTSETYAIPIVAAAGVGYGTDFEGDLAPAGWVHDGGNDSWEWGAPTSGPRSAASGEKVFATILAGNAKNNSADSLRTPPISIPAEGEVYLQFKQWYDIDSNPAGDKGRVYVIDANGEKHLLASYGGYSRNWLQTELSLTEFAGQTVTIEFYYYSDGFVSFNGWYLDDVYIADASDAVGGLGMVTPATAVEEAVKVSEQAGPMKPLSTANAVTPNNIPVAATVTVNELGITVNTDPFTGAFNLRLSEGDYTLTGEAYGYYPATVPVTAVENVVVQTTIVLDPIATGTVTGTVINEQTGERVAGAKVYLTEDASVAPVFTDDEGNFTIRGLEGNYTLRFTAQNYRGTDVMVTIDGDVMLAAVYMNPFIGTAGELVLDDGTQESGIGVNNCADCAMANRFIQPAGQTTTVVGANFKLHAPYSGNPAVDVEIWSAGEDGAPRELIGGPVRVEDAIAQSWNYVDLSDLAIQAHGTFFVVTRNVGESWSYGMDNDTDDRANLNSWAYLYEWAPISQQSSFNGTFMIRAVVEQEVGAPTILTPADGTVTDVAEVVVTGTAEPHFTVNLFNGDTEAAVTVADADGTFAATVTLVAGENVLTANIENEQGYTDRSAPITVV
jgi:bacillopeptidase F (M6 metalloprotease family)